MKSAFVAIVISVTGLSHLHEQADEVFIRVGPIEPRITDLDNLLGAQMIKEVELRVDFPHLNPACGSLLCQ